MNKAVILFIAAFLCSSAYGSIGKLTEVTGPTEITRDKDKIEGKVDVSVEMEDRIETLKARVSITFEDDTKMQVTEYSKLTIDEFIYDKSSKKGTLSVKAAFGTVRYASGLIAKNSRENVRVTTPTAKISVRGTDFSMTVSEDGKSLVVLLPSIPLAAGGEPVIGMIEVSNMGGTVLLNQAYQATLVSSMNAPPSNPVVLDFQDESKINNMLIVDTPKSVTQANKETKKNQQQTVAADNSDSSQKKYRSSSKTKITQVGESGDKGSVDIIGSSETADGSNTPAEAAAAAAVAQSEETTIDAKPTTILDLNAIQPQTLQSVADAISVVTTKIDLPSPTLVIPSVTTGVGFSSNGVTATYTYEKNGNIIKYITKANTNATLNLTTKDGTQTIPLNFGGKSIINIIQK
jgi:hypothetical protein